MASKRVRITVEYLDEADRKSDELRIASLDTSTLAMALDASNWESVGIN